MRRENKETEENSVMEAELWRRRSWLFRRWRKRNDVVRDGVRVRQGDVGAVYPSSAAPGATRGVKLLTSVWTVVSGGAELHQGNETPRFYYGPRCIMGGQKETFGGNRL